MTPPATTIIDVEVDGERVDVRIEGGLIVVVAVGEIHLGACVGAP